MNYLSPGPNEISLHTCLDQCVTGMGGTVLNLCTTLLTYEISDKHLFISHYRFIGSYPDIEGGTPRDAYLALTGGCAEWLALSYYKFDPAEVYNRIRNALKHGSVVVTSATVRYKSNSTLYV